MRTDEGPSKARAEEALEMIHYVCVKPQDAHYIGNTTHTLVGKVSFAVTY
jgi:hypothetical protein